LSLPIKVLSKILAHKIKSDWVDATVDKSKTEAEYAKVMPKIIVIML